MTDTLCSDATKVNYGPEPRRLVQAGELLNLLWPDEHSRPSLRWLRQQQALANLPAVRVGRRVWFNLDAVRQHISVRLTIQPAGKQDVPFADTLVDAPGALAVLEVMGVRRSLRWLRDQQSSRLLPYIRWGGRVFFSPAQIRQVLLVDC